jgi:type IV pilus assembly protein PilC
MQNQNQNSKSEALLKTLANKQNAKSPAVIYGLYEASKQPLLTRLNDFLIDHSKVPLQEKAYFFQLLAVTVDAGIPVIQGVKMLADRSTNERFRRILHTVAYTVSQGKTLSESLARFPDVFGELEVGVVRAGEAAGSLDKMLLRLAEQLSKSNELQIKLITASIYPVAVLIVLTLASIGMLIWVVPSLVNLLKEGGLEEKDFPFATRFLIDLSSFMANYWWAVLFAAILGYLTFRVAISTQNGRYRFDILKLKMPVIGVLLRKVLILRFVNMLGILIEAGLPVIQALNIVASSLSNEIYRLKVYQVSSKVQQGQRISESLLDTPFLFPETIVQMLAVGEQSASLGLISTKIAKQYDIEIDNALKRLTSLFEPIMIIFVGFTVAILALAILTPIFRLSQLI